MLQKPNSSEYHSYFERYIDLVPEGNLAMILLQQLDETKKLLSSISKEEAEYKYAEGKWSLKEVIGHITDTERVMSYRLLVLARGDSTNLPSFDENTYVINANYKQLELSQILSDYVNVRQSTLSLLSTIAEESFLNVGHINNSPTTARAVAYTLTGHELHHLNIIKERYL